MNKFTVIYTTLNKKGNRVQTQVSLTSSSIEEAELYFKNTYMEAYPDIEMVAVMPELSLV